MQKISGRGQVWDGVVWERVVSNILPAKNAYTLEFFISIADFS